jgi:hypothetical protein
MITTCCQPARAEDSKVCRKVCHSREIFENYYFYGPFGHQKVTLYRHVSRTNMFLFGLGLIHNHSPNPNSIVRKTWRYNLKSKEVHIFVVGFNFPAIHLYSVAAEQFLLFFLFGWGANFHKLSNISNFFPDLTYFLLHIFKTRVFLIFFS